MAPEQTGEQPNVQARFPGLVYNKEGEPAPVVRIGEVDHYAVPAGDFVRHVEASTVDEWVPWLEMAGFRIVVDIHGEVVRVNYPEAPDEAN